MENYDVQDASLIKCDITNYNNDGRKNSTVAGNFYCEVCEKTYYTLKKLKIHMFLHKHMEEFNCQDCCKSFNVKSVLKRHIATVHGGLKRFNCDICDKTFKLKWHLNDHKQRHGGAKKYVCEICSKCFFQKTELKRHNLTHARKLTKKPYSQEEQIGKQKTEELTHFTKESNIYSSETISKNTTGEINTTHNNSNECFTCPEGLKKCKCEVCGKLMCDKRTLNWHIGSVHRSKVRYICEVCGKTFRRFQKLTEHLAREHEGNKILYRCNICGLAFTTKENLKNHVGAIHEQIRNFYCAACGKGFYLKGALKIHIGFIHRNIKKFNCVICGKSFRVSEELRVHVTRVHSGNRNFKCNKMICTEYTLKQHFGRQHSIKTEKCNVCYRKFAKIKSLLIHVNRMHKDHKNYKFTD